MQRKIELNIQIDDCRVFPIAFNYMALIRFDIHIIYSIITYIL
jgi:hypothetical protein